MEPSKVQKITSGDTVNARDPHADRVSNSERLQPDQEFGLQLFGWPIAVLCGLLAQTALLLTDSAARESLLGVTIVFIALAVCLYVWQIRVWLIVPMRELRAWALQMCAGDLSARLPPQPHSEFAKLAFHINRLSQALDSLANDMDDVVSSQTEQLQARNQSLEMLYDVAATINRVPISLQVDALGAGVEVEQILSDAARLLLPVVNGRAAMLRLRHDGSKRLLDVDGCAGLIAAYEQDAVQLPEALDAFDLRILNPEVLARLNWPVTLFGDEHSLLSIPLSYRRRVLGSIELIAPIQNIDHKPELRRLFASVGAHLGMAIEKHRLDVESHNVSIVRERNALAHELHDSLAQTIASLGLQVSLLQETIASENLHAARRECARIRGFVDEAHLELRELLANFRAPVIQGGLMAALEPIVSRTRAECHCAVYLQLDGDEPRLPATTQLQVMRIVSESLVNARKHSQAQMLRVLVQNDPHTGITVLIEDDGVGIGQQILSAHPGERLGLSIMRERAQRAGGVLSIESEADEGTRVELRIPPPDTTTTVI
jgi:two-component system, NarL family, nitrate/nitrite sensor histidine kinase NarX